MNDSIGIPKIPCLLLEDDLHWMGIMEETLKLNYPQLDLYCYTSIAEASLSYSQHQQTLLILDINLPDGSSFEWLRKLQEAKEDRFRVIFTTAFADYALQAFRFSALDFLLKPYLPQDLLAAADKALKSLNDHHYRQQLETFIHNYTHQDKKIILKTLDEIFIIPIGEILAVEADNSYTSFLLESGQHILVSQPLKEFDSQLSPAGFMRVHQSHLVNLKHITGYKKKTNMLLLKGQLQVPVSQNKKAKVMTYLNSL